MVRLKTTILTFIFKNNKDKSFIHFLALSRLNRDNAAAQGTTRKAHITWCTPLTGVRITALVVVLPSKAPATNSLSWKTAIPKLLRGVNTEDTGDQVILRADISNM